VSGSSEPPGHWRVCSPGSKASVLPCQSDIFYPRRTTRQPPGRDSFEQLSYSNQHRHVLGVTQAKTAQTRQRRIDKVVAELSATGG
jgi:hypothetical protein